jgi:hypothetical protein
VKDWGKKEGIIALLIDLRDGLWGNRHQIRRGGLSRVEQISRSRLGRRSSISMFAQEK